MGSLIRTAAIFALTGLRWVYRTVDNVLAKPLKEEDFLLLLFKDDWLFDSAPHHDVLGGRRPLSMLNVAWGKYIDPLGRCHWFCTQEHNGPLGSLRDGLPREPILQAGQIIFPSLVLLHMAPSSFFITLVSKYNQRLFYLSWCSNSLGDFFQDPKDES